jgi:stage II sporulation protein AA (anti-sigma F factor antagonist)
MKNLLPFYIFLRRQNMDYECSNKVLIYYLPEELDHFSADRIKRKSEHEFTSGNVQHIIFDFADVRFMDSSGIGLITGRYRKIKGGSVYVINADENIDKLLLLSGIYRIAVKKDSKEEIINDLLKGEYYAE